MIIQQESQKLVEPEDKGFADDSPEMVLARTVAGMHAGGLKRQALFIALSFIGIEERQLMSLLDLPATGPDEARFSAIPHVLKAKREVKPCH